MKRYWSRVFERAAELVKKEVDDPNAAYRLARHQVDCEIRRQRAALPEAKNNLKGYLQSVVPRCIVTYSRR